ncbi:amino acid ABC transporter permease [Nonomuraea sp. KC401]|uniref:amino acid ABC transporter permease n=1 Tax=unclassified Nonomuraea TaxID=2593643 RepID=UPI0010FD48CE|nr:MULTISPECIES: amino acid ABC transporter permease [unclassified Nonomuraea]NBE98407.1 ABC transporter permease subunit [Nonomuraea sp. K271]TLF61092.1 amino acid ABC transporter permease [Nonomuraea sp. KC401]
MTYANLYEPPGPRGIRRNRALAAGVALVLLAVAYFVFVRFDEKDQWAADKWTPLLRGDVWATFILPGLAGTLTAAVTGVVLAGLFGIVFATARMSDHRWIRMPAAAVVEFFRSVPLLLLIFFAFFGSFALLGTNISAFSAVVFGLTLYNGSVIAEIIRAGVQSLPRGQREAAYAMGMRKGQVMRLVLLPQALKAMMPALVSQFVVLLKDSALGLIVGYDELVDRGLNGIAANFSNVIPAAILIAAIFILINLSLDRLAHRLSAGRRRVTAPNPA